MESTAYRKAKSTGSLFATASGAIHPSRASPTPNHDQLLHKTIIAAAGKNTLGHNYGNIQASFSGCRRKIPPQHILNVLKQRSSPACIQHNYLQVNNVCHKYTTTVVAGEDICFFACIPLQTSTHSTATDRLSWPAKLLGTRESSYLHATSISWSQSLPRSSIRPIG